MFWTTLVTLCNQRGISPTKLCEILNLSNATAVRWKKGSIPQDTTLIKIADYFNVSTDYLLGKPTQNLSDYFNIKEVEEQGMIPVYGLVSAGKGIFAQEEIVAWESVDKKYAKPGYFYLKVSGDSMSPKIDDGDLVLVRSQTSVDSGTIGIFSVEEEGFIKKVEYNDTHISLISFNPQYPPMEFDGMDVLKVRVIGKVIELKRKF